MCMFSQFYLHVKKFINPWLLELIYFLDTGVLFNLNLSINPATRLYDFIVIVSSIITMLSILLVKYIAIRAISFTNACTMQLNVFIAFIVDFVWSVLKIVLALEIIDQDHQKH